MRFRSPKYFRGEWCENPAKIDAKYSPHHCLSPQRLKPFLEMAVYRSGEPLRHPKSRETSTSFASC